MWHIGGFQMSNGENDLTRLRYEKGLEIRYHEVDLLFQRFNFFMVGMSFLVAAFAAIVASDHSDELRGISLAIVGIGALLSLGFFVINYSAARNITRFDDYLLKVELEVGLKDRPFLQALLLANNRPFKDSHWYCLWHCRAPHTRLIPLGFTFFWAIVGLYQIPGHEYMCFRNEGICWWVLAGLVLTFLFSAAITVLVVWAVFKLTGHSTRHNDAIGIALSGYANGEITKEEFDQIKKDLA